MASWTFLINSYFPRPIEKLPSLEVHFNNDLYSEITIIPLNVLATFACHQRNILLLCLFTKGRSTTAEINTPTKQLHSTNAEFIMETNYPAIVSSGNQIKVHLYDYGI